MNITQVKKHFGLDTDTELARLVGISSPAVSQWRSTGKIPPLRQVQLEWMSRGKLRASTSWYRSSGDRGAASKRSARG